MGNSNIKVKTHYVYDKHADLLVMIIELLCLLSCNKMLKEQSWIEKFEIDVLILTYLN